MNQSGPTTTEAALLPPATNRRSWLEMGGWGILCLATVALAFAYAYYTIFTQFRDYDDEGFILISLKSFFQGKALYDEVYSCYQPCFYVFNWLLFSLLGTPVCHDSIRFLTVTLWLAGAMLNGLIAYRLTSSGLLALLVAVLSLRCLGGFANEPGHPQALAYFLVAAMVALFAFAEVISRRILALGLGGLVGLLLLTKINVGIFALIPAGFVCVLGCNGRFGRWVQVLAGALMLALPAALMPSGLAGHAWPAPTLCLWVLLPLLLIASLFIRPLQAGPLMPVAWFLFGLVVPMMDFGRRGPEVWFSAWLVTWSIYCVVLVGRATPIHSGSGRPDLRWIVLGFSVACGAILSLLLLRGTSFAGLLNGIVCLPAKQSTTFYAPWRSNLTGVWLALAGAVGCWGYLRAREPFGHQPWFRAAISAAKLLFGVTVLAEFQLCMTWPTPYTPLFIGLPHFWMLPFAWLVLASSPSRPADQFARLALLAVTVLQPLIAYPIAGSQLVPASVLLCVVAAVCLADALRGLLPNLSDLFRGPWLRFAAGGIAGISVVLSLGLDSFKLANRYAALTPLHLPGMKHVRLRQEEVRTFEELVGSLARPEVETFLTLPGLNSLYLWAQKDPPTGLNVTTWMTLFDAASQERIWQAAQQHPGLVVVRNNKVVAFWMRGRPVNHLPLVQHIEENFTTASSQGGYELMVRR
jgi:hypothetical protein